MRRTHILLIVLLIGIVAFAVANMLTASEGIEATRDAAKRLGGYEESDLTLASADFGYNLINQYTQVVYQVGDTPSTTVYVSVRRFSFLNNWQVDEFHSEQ
jgi:hypothetical protein